MDTLGFLQSFVSCSEVLLSSHFVAVLPVEIASNRVFYLLISSQDFSVCILLKCNEMFFIPEFERAAKIRKIAVYRFLISLLVPEL